MKMRAINIPVGLLGVLVVGLTLAVAAPSQQPAPGRTQTALPQTPAAIFKTLDRNGDGVITLDEWLAAGRKEQVFRSIDTNHDGQVTLEEFAVAMPATSSAPASLQSMISGMFKAMDRNGDGVITLDEWIAAGRHEKGFQRLDANHDGKITLQEFETALATYMRGAGSEATANLEIPKVQPVLKTMTDANGCALSIRAMPAGDATSAAESPGDKMFRSIAVPGITDVYAATDSGVLADFNGDGLVDVLLVQSVGSPLKPEGRLRLLLNRGCFHFEEHKIDIENSGFTADNLGLENQIANVADFNKDGYLDILLTRSRGAYDHPSIGNSLLVSDGAFDRFHDVGGKMGIRNAQGYNRATAIGDLNGDGWLDFAVGADNIGNTRRLGIPRSRIYIYQPAPSGRFEDGHYEDISDMPWKHLVPGFPGEFGCNPTIDRAGPDILFRDLNGDGWLDILQAYHIDMNGAHATDLCASGEYWTGISLWKNMTGQTGKFGFDRIQDNGIAQEGRALYDPAKQIYVTDKPAMSLPYIFTGDVMNDGRQDVLAIGPTDPAWTVTTDKSAVKFWLNQGNLKFNEASKTDGLDALNWTYRQWADFWHAKLPAKTEFMPLECKMNQLQVPICDKMTIGDYKFYMADAIMEDFNNDGNIDILVADRREGDGMWGILRNVLFLGDGHGNFKPIPTEISGIGRNCMSMQVADLNNDGLLDLICFASPFNSYPPMLRGLLPPLPMDRHLNTVYWNTGAFGARVNHWLELRFSGADQSLLIGAEVEAFEGGTLLGSRQLTTAESYKAGGELMAHFGLGQHQAVDVHVKLRTGDHWFKGLQANAIYILNLKGDTADRCCQAPAQANGSHSGVSQN
jgi:Ca2+-binding EF-hand superfamily protein